MNPEEELEAIEVKRRDLKQAILRDRKTKLRDEKGARIMRDAKIDKNLRKLNKVQEEIYSYKKLGQVEKGEFDIFGKILSVIQEDITIGPPNGVEAIYVDEELNTGD